jgi:predicted ester cyclase
MVKGAFSDFQLTLADLFAEGDRVCWRYVVRGTHTGPFLGVPPTGRPVTYSLIGIARIADGKIVERWIQFDRLGILQQFGVLPGQPAA